MIIIKKIVGLVPSKIKDPNSLRLEEWLRNLLPAKKLSKPCQWDRHRERKIQMHHRFTLNLNVLITAYLILNIINLSTGANQSTLLNTLVKVKKCCPIQEYYNVETEKCEQWISSGKSSRTRWSTVDQTSGRKASWNVPIQFYQWFSHEHQPILEFDSMSVGMPHCATGNEEDIRTEVVKIMDEEINVTLDLMGDWIYDWQNEVNYFFLAGDPKLVEVTPTSPYKEIYHNPEQFCVDLTETELILRICRCTPKQPCIRKCCGLNKHYKYDDNNVNITYDCVHSPVGTGLPLHSSPGVLLTDQERRKLQPRYVVGKTECNNPFLVTSGSDLADIQGAFIIEKDGTFQFYHAEKKTWNKGEEGTAYTDLCFENIDVPKTFEEICPGETEAIYICLNVTKPHSVINHNHNQSYFNGSNMLPFNSSLIDFNLGFNFSQNYTRKRMTDAKTDGSEVWPIVYHGALVISTIVLLITAIILFLLLEKKNLHSWTRLAYVLSHFLFFFLLGLTHAKVVRPGSQLDISKSGKGDCKAVAVLIHFMGLTTACWLSIINFDLWWTFKVLKPRSGDKLDIWRFIWYTSFSLGLPLFIVSVALVIESQDPQFICLATAHLARPISPNYGGARKCSLSDEARPAYWFGPLFILLVANLIFFCTTTCRMMNLQKMSRRASIESTNGQTQSRKIFIKIFIVSGVTWWVEIIQWGFKNNSGAWYWLVIDMVHFIQAIALFVIFVCKRDVIRSLQIKYPIITKVIPPVSAFQRSNTMASMSTDPSSKSFRIVRQLTGRKMSTVSSTSSNNGNGNGTSNVPTETYQKRQESIELPASSTLALTSANESSTQQPVPVSILSSSVNSKSGSKILDSSRKDSATSTSKHVQVQEPGPDLHYYIERRETTESETSFVNQNQNSK